MKVGIFIVMRQVMNLIERIESMNFMSGEEFEDLKTFEMKKLLNDSLLYYLMLTTKQNSLKDSFD